MLRLFTLGELRLESDDGQPRLRRRKPLILLAFLARRAPRAVPRSELVALLWGERPEALARQSLRQALLELHRALGDQLIITHDTVQLLSGAVRLDVADFERDVDAGRNREAIERWAAEFLAGSDDRAEDALRSWTESERAGLRRRLGLACERLVDDAERRGASREATVVARRWTELAPLDEAASRRLILALRRDGRVVDALAHHDTFVARLAQELDTTPSRDFLRMSRSLAETEQHERSRERGSSSGATARLPLVGREAAFTVLTTAWRERAPSSSTLVIVEAAPGMGSTRLANEFASWVKAQQQATVVLRATGDRREGARYRSASQLVDRLTAAPALAGLPPDTLRQLAFLLPRLRERFTHLPAPGAAPDEQALAHAIRDALEAVAEDGPVLVLAGRVEDMDHDSRTLLLRVAASTGVAVMFVVVVRDEDERREVQQRLGESPTAVALLTPLSVADIRAALDGVAQLRTEDRDALAALIHADTDGIPRHLAPAVAELIEDGLLKGGKGSEGKLAMLLSGQSLPTSYRIDESVRARLHSLSDAEVRLLEICAVLAIPVRARRIARIAGASFTECIGVIDALQRAGWLARTSSDRVLVSPPIVARALYAVIPPLRREAIHASVARELSSTGRWRLPRAERNRIAYHREQGGAPAERRLFTRAHVVTAVAAALVAGALLWHRSPSTQPATRNVAIFPFAVSGGTRFDFLRAGMVDLLSTSLDGAAGLHTADPHVVIAATNASGAGRSLTPDQARVVARKLGVTQFVLGTVVAVGTRLQTSAMLYHVDGDAAPVARASAEGSETSLFDIVDRLTAQLAVTQSSAPGERLTQLAAVTTTSLDALKAYLAGRSAYRANDLFAALESYQHAVTADSTFSLAWYGLASTASWMMRPDIERRAAAEAVRQGSRLSARDRALVLAFDAYSRGSADSAERLAATITETYDDIEAWVLLGEVLYHHNWKRGRSLVESRRAWERVIALDPTFWPALQHLAEVAAVDGRAGEADSLLARYERSVGTPHMMIASRAMRGYAFGDTASRIAIEPQLASDRGFWLILSVWYVSVMGRDVADGSKLARLLLEPTRAAEQQGFGRILLAHLDLARGRWREARAELAAARAQTPADALEYELLLDLAPFLPAPAGELERDYLQLERLPVHAADNSRAMAWPHTQGFLRPLARAYLAGMIGARTQVDGDRLRALASLAALPDPTAVTAMRDGFVGSIRAEHARAQHRPQAALGFLERSARQTPFVAAWTSGFVSQAYERYLRAELLHELHRDDEALRWYGTFGENSPYDLVYLAPSLYRQGQIYEAHGEKALAAARYARFVGLWKDCDPELAPLVTDARARIEALR